MAPEAAALLNRPRLLLADNTDRVDQRVTLLCLAHQIFKANVDAGGVVAIRNRYEHLLILLGFLFQVVHRHTKGIAHSCAAFGLHTVERLFPFLDVAGEGLIEIRFIVKIHDEHLS